MGALARGIVDVRGNRALIIRAATAQDIPAMHRIRLAVRENPLADPARLTIADYARRIAGPGDGWVVESDGQVIGFGIVDRASRSLWALFVDPDCEARGAGRALLARLTESLFARGPEPINVSTTPGTRAERMYLAAGWARVGELPTGEAWLVRPTPARD
jgi:GNAT superfamily N-acetyltransferase